MNAIAALLAVPPPATGGHGSKSPLGFLIGGVVFLLIGGFQAVKPRTLWKMNRWAYKHPEANEPSDKGFLAWRVGGAIAAVVGVVLIVIAITKL